MSNAFSTEFRSLSDDESRALLARNNVGRLAYSFHDTVDILPIHYVFDGSQWLYGRTSPSEKIETLLHHRWVAFEVDEVKALFQWRSVVVRGGFYPLTGEGAVADEATVTHAITLLRHLLPSTFKPQDPASFRTVLFRIAVQEMSGRAAD